MLILRQDRVTIFDGAIGTELFRRGCALEDCPELYALKHPNIIKQVHEDYIEAGADVISTATFGAYEGRLATFGKSGETRSINRTLAAMAVNAAAGRARVAGIAGPAPGDEAEASIEDRILGLAEAHVDFILLETFTSLTEAVSALKMARELCSLPIGLSFTFDASLRTAEGIEVEQAARQIEASGASFVGANCMTNSEDLVRAITALKKAVKLPVLARPNAGIPGTAAGKLHYPVSESEFLGIIEQLIEAGAGAVGGCCGTTPDYIRMVREKVA